MSDAMARTNIGKYEVVKLLGEGAMGVVYLTHDPSLDRQVAIKLIRKEIVGGRQGPQMVARFRNEAMAAARLQHPGIVAVYDYGEDEDSCFIVMEYAPGEDLEEYGNKYAPLGLPELATLMAQLLDALSYAHGCGVVHRDIKPSNLLITGANRLKITDFGIARIASSKLTQTGTAMGTPMYMAPEQYSGSGVDHRADLFSAGVLFYELLTGVKPFAGDSIQEIAYKICYAEVSAPTEHNPFLPPALDACALKALAKDKTARFPSAAEFARELGEAIGSGQRLSSSGTRISVPAWPSDVTKALEAALVPSLGPLAGTLVRRSAARTLDKIELVELLRRGAGDDADSPSLLKSLNAIVGTGAGSSPAPRTTLPPTTAASPAVRGAAALTVDELERATQALVGLVGPIAKVLVKKASPSAKDFRDLCLRLSEHLASDHERATFLGKVGVR